MNKNEDIRWMQRLASYNRALAKLSSGLDIEDDDDEEEDEEENNKRLAENFTELEKEGIIQRFEYTHELAWNLMKDYLEFQGNSNIKGPRDATREAFKAGLLEDGESWMEMIGSRNQTSHLYNEDTAGRIFLRIARVYHPLFIALSEKMEVFRSGNQADMFSQEL